MKLFSFSRCVAVSLAFSALSFATTALATPTLEVTSGRLAPRVARRDTRGFYSVNRNINLTAGESVELSIESPDFDTTVKIQGPGGQILSNDDGIENTTNSRLLFRAVQNGTYRITVSSYTPRSTGNFNMTLKRDVPINDDTEGMSSSSIPANPYAGMGRVVGVFVGISNYGGGNNLAYTAQDARNMARSFQQHGIIQPGDVHLLTDSMATANNLRATFNQIKTTLTPDDTLIFFFDGHGGEGSIVLSDGDMRDKELSGLLGSNSAQQLLIFDSCYSGSLADLVRNNPRRVGLFSSRGTETSAVATEVRAGGWLAYFVLQGMDQSLDQNQDNAVQVSEIASYVRNGYDLRVSRSEQNLVMVNGSGNAALTLWQLSH